jgi:asparaginyl-tRNA synthetase
LVQVETPIITSSDCEGAGEVFELKPKASSSLSSSPPPLPPQPPTAEHFLGRPAYMTVSAQLHLEALAASLGRVYTLGPTFRAEPSNTNRHLAEFWMLEAELSFCSSLGEVMDLVEALVRHLATNGLSEAEDVADYFRSVDPSLSQTVLDQASTNGSSSSSPWPRISYTEAVDLLVSRHATEPFTFTPVWGESLQSEHEKWLAETHVGGPVFVTDYPATIKPFYMRPNDSDDGRTVACFDLLVPRIGELAGGSLREERLEELLEKMRAEGMDEAEYEWYLDLRRYGTTMHGGFGLGWERLVSWLTGVDNLKECIAFPRVRGGPDNFVA